jgi:hypothetical protein
MTFLDEAFDILSALAHDRDTDDPTFRRMVVTYRAVAAELACSEAYEQRLADLLLSLPSGVAASQS